MNFLRDTAEFTIVIFVANHLTAISNWAFKRALRWWKERHGRADIKWLQDSRSRPAVVLKRCLKCGRVHETEWNDGHPQIHCEDCLDSGN